jgi:hypothetical protein
LRRTRWKQGKREDRQLRDLIADPNLEAAEITEEIDSTHRLDPPSRRATPRVPESPICGTRENPEISKEESQRVGNPKRQRKRARIEADHNRAVAPAGVGGWRGGRAETSGGGAVEHAASHVSTGQGVVVSGPGAFEEGELGAAMAGGASF